MVAAGKLSCAFALVASASANGVATPSTACLHMLTDVTSQGRSDMELAAFCRARLPPQFCKEAASSLGQQPWAPDRMASTCKNWEDRWNAQSAAAAPAREAKAKAKESSAVPSSFVNFNELQAYLDQCMSAKASAGICKKPNKDKPMSLNECIDYKQKTYPEQTQRFSTAINNFYTHVMSKSEQQQAPAAAPHDSRMGLLVGLGSVLAATTAAAAGFLRFRRQRGRRAVVAGGAEEELGHVSEELIAE